MNIVLIGYRCSGKTEVGKIIARELGMEFIDTDLLIEENTGCSIESIVSEKGWDHFRKIERRTIVEVSERDNVAVATGGGVVMDRNNVQNLNRNGFIVWLKGDAEILKERMGKEQRTGKTRPSLTGIDPLEEIHKVLKVRTPLYQQIANLTVDTSRLSTEEVAHTIMQKLPQGLQD